LADKLNQNANTFWLLTYDNKEEIKSLYPNRKIVDFYNDGTIDKVFENRTPWRDVRMGDYRKPSQQEIEWYREHYESIWGKKDSE